MRDSGSQSLIANPGELLVSVVLSFRNEAETIPELIRRLLQVFDKIPAQFELIFVNDNSSDESLELLMKLNPRNRFLANVSPKNKKSTQFFKKN